MRRVRLILMLALIVTNGVFFGRRWLARAERDPKALQSHLAKLEKKLEGREFTILVETPFVVIGDDDPESVRRWGEKTVRWAVSKLKQGYFDADPDIILDIWLFKDETSYSKHTLEFFGREPSTPYGFYSRADLALVMNISTGGGTLVHEIVHPFMEKNFPECPAWFNEGLASLYEQSSERDGHIVGLTNWRLAGLKKAIKDGRLPSFEALCRTTTGAFYDDDRGTNYAQARYLCYYLQENDRLRQYYRTFRDRWEEDPTGYEFLQEVLGEPDMPAFQKRWEDWVLTLRFPE